SDGVSQAVGQCQSGRGLPGVLSEALPHIGAEYGIGTVADFGVRVIKTQGSVGNSEARAAGAVVRERELSVLVVGAGRASLHVDLVIVVLAGALPQAAKLNRVIAFNPGKAVRNVVNGPSGVRRIGPTAESRKTRHGDGGNTSRDQLRVRKYVLIQVAGHGGAVASLRAIEKVLRVNRDLDDVLARSDEEFIHLARADRPNVVDRSGSVGAIEKFRCSVGVSIQWLVFEIVVIGGSKPQVMPIRRIDVNGKCVFALVKGVTLGSEPVAASDEGIGNRPHVQDADSIRAQSV